ncbi:tetratricopeptide repeat-containing response regulator [Rhodocyclus tenuis]|uniref:CheY-like chemotaxis protein n=1 Tax=Rhodocyclus tenuis TaxID=1066 RepID=A0A840G9R9_RHOTE|nr:tetratricopeptide repeat-containing response regulator [Rhodocyclus tenuis]MBB4248211.1 CheY-like chemotaxis protein [Rhodocyclus tenuis]
MAITTTLSNKHFLVLDDQPEMRSSLRAQIGSLGCTNVVVCANVKGAIEQFEKRRFDVVLCDYYLGGGTDGQQFLEYLRSRELISRGTIFIMITAEKSYESVVTAAECLPDDYLLKPFTADTLHSRVERQLEKKARLAKINTLQDKRKWAEVVTACDEIIASRDRYQVDAMRIRGNALIAAGRFDEAIAFYQQVLAARALPWAKFGLAHALHAKGELAASKATLGELIVESPRFLSAYDLLGRAHLESGQADEAMKVLDQATQVAPNSLTRHRAIAKVAEEQADFSRVEAALSQVVKKTRNTPLRNTGDIARLGNAFTELGTPDKAIALIEEAKTNFKGDQQDPHLAAIEALAHSKAGRPELAAKALARVAENANVPMSPEVTVQLAKAYLANGQIDAGEAILKRVVQTSPDSKEVHALVTKAMSAHGSPERAQALIAGSIGEVVALNNEAVRRGKAGELGAAAQMLTEAAERLPENVQIVANAAFALLLDVFSNGLDQQKFAKALAFQQQLQALDERHPKLADIAALTTTIRNKFNILEQPAEST